MEGDQCDWPRCKRTPALRWLGKWLCWTHWQTIVGWQERLPSADWKKRARRTLKMEGKPQW